MVWIDSGEFLMGSEHHYAEEAPVREIRVSGFWIDQYAVTNAEYANFIEKTGYVTVAERPLDPSNFPGVDPFLLQAGSMVFSMTKGPVSLQDIRQWWSYVPGASWRHPEGPGSDLKGRANHPVVQIAFEDAKSYAAWASKDIPTEAEWEFAARGGLEGAEYVWGNSFEPDGKRMAKTWQGDFPWRNKAKKKLERTSPVGSYPGNGYGLFDMVGNVWQWTSDYYVAGHPSKKQEGPFCCTLDNPRGPTMHQSLNSHTNGIPVPSKVVKGGSFLCAPSYCRRYRPAARHAQQIDTGMSHIGFRCITRLSQTEKEIK
ncbi:MAG: formylglycine-generating enzyme family protein [Tateyamaria sp.]|nr:formylglycine-generating enzyme family protein [Tateyamaria sp.]